MTTTSKLDTGHTGYRQGALVKFGYPNMLEWYDTNQLFWYFPNGFFYFCRGKFFKNGMIYGWDGGVPVFDY